MATRVAIIGNVDSGKSTLVGVLTRGGVDDGRGAARSVVFRHQHEASNGRTSSVGLEVMGWTEDGQQVFLPRTAGQNKAQRWGATVAASAHSVALIDLAGHEKYLATTAWGLTGLSCHYATVVVGANMGVQHMTREHLSIATGLAVPVCVVITKIDMCPPDVLKDTKRALARTLRAHGKKPFHVKSAESLGVAMDGLAADALVPVFSVSAVTGEGLDLLRTFVRDVPTPAADPAAVAPQPDAPTVFPVDAVYSVPGAGIVAAGTLTAGSVSVGDELQLGPLGREGRYVPVRVRSLQVNCVPGQTAAAGDSATLGVRAVNRREPLRKALFRKGVVLLGRGAPLKAVRTFTAEIFVLHHSTTVARGFSPFINCGVVRQSAQVTDISSGAVGGDGEIVEDKLRLRSGDRARVTFRFAYRPEYLVDGARFIFRDGTTKGIGRIVSTSAPPAPAPPVPAPVPVPAVAPPMAPVAVEAR